MTLPSLAQGSPPRPNILFITIDTLRPDAMGWVSGVDTTPTLDALAAGGVAFSAAVAPAPLTLPSHASMFSGLVPRRHGVRDNHQVVGPAPPLLAERLVEAGYSTAAIVSGFPLTSQFGLDRGFEYYDDLLTAGKGAWLERPAGETAAAAIAWLDEGAPGEEPKPWFLWVHFYDPHFPYEPPAGFERPGRRGAYDGEVAWVDSRLGPLLQAARDSGPELLTVVAADHGEALGQHGEGTHGFFVYDDTVLVPLIFSWPGHLAAQRSAAGARLIDLTPTLLELLDLGALSESDGVSLAPLLSGNSMSLPAAYVETLQPWHSYGWAPLAAVRDQGFKLIAAPAPELYDLEVDPRESENLFGQGTEQELALRRRLRAIEALPSVAGASLADPDTLANLRALGYLGTPDSGPIPDRAGLPDPKDQLELRQLLTQGDEDLRAGRLAPAASSFRRVLATDSGNRFAQSRLGLALLGLGQLPEAHAALAKAVELAPNDPEAQTALASLLTRTGDPASAVTHWLEVVRLQPRRAAGWSNLGAALGMSDQSERATAAYRKAAELEPADPARWIRLAFAAFASGSSKDAIVSLERAAKISGTAGFAHAGTLGLLLAREGRTAEAMPWLRRSQAAEGDFIDARLTLVRLLLAEGSNEEARSLLLEGVRLRPELRQAAAQDPALARLLG